MFLLSLPGFGVLNRLVAIVFISIFAVLTHWGVWTNDVLSMGWNTTLVWLALGGLLVRGNPKICFSDDWCWLLPLALLSISFALYENPWLKTISFIVMPVCVGVFFSFGQLKSKRQHVWRMHTVIKLGLNSCSVVPAIPESFKLLREAFITRLDGSNLDIFKRIIRAVAILLPLMFIVLVLLSSADENFDAIMSGWFSRFADFLDWSIAAKIVCVVIVSGVLLAVNNTLTRELTLEGEMQPPSVDDLIASIVLLAILLVYIAFLSLQLDYLLVDSLPIEFADTERLVKSGFWQLFFLSMINVGLFYWVYKNTGSIAQWILRLYLIASVLILLSAAWRMGLYVFYYGFSYEKFFASYTTFYALLLFCFLGWAAFSASLKDIVKMLCLSSLWMFSIVTILPVERIIFHSNMALSLNQGSRIDLFHLTDLSSDVLADVNLAFNSGRLSKPDTWANWQKNKLDKRCIRAWYETNLSLQLNCSSLDVNALPKSNWQQYED